MVSLEKYQVLADILSDANEERLMRIATKQKQQVMCSVERDLKGLLVILFLFTLMVFFNSAFAFEGPTHEKRAPVSPQEGGMMVYSLDPSFDVQPFERFGFKVRSYESFGKQRSQILPPEERDVLLKKADLLSYVEKWGHLDRDRLLIRARIQTINELQKAYPILPTPGLQRLQGLLVKGQ